MLQPPKNLPAGTITFPLIFSFFPIGSFLEEGTHFSLNPCLSKCLSQILFHVFLCHPMSLHKICFPMFLNKNVRVERQTPVHENGNSVGNINLKREGRGWNGQKLGQEGEGCQDRTGGCMGG